MSSDGWNWNWLGPSQRFAPLTLTPMCGTCAASTSTNETASSGAVIRWTFATPSRASSRIATSPMRRR